MRGGLLGSWYGLSVLVLLGACSNIIGISSYEIDPALDTASGGKAINKGKGAGGKSSGGTSSGGTENGDPNSAGQPSVSEGGIDGGGGETVGSTVGGTSTSTGGSAPAAAGSGEGGAAESSGCSKQEDCDDEIDCTHDSCATTGECVHTPDDTLCTPASGSCATCVVGIGCPETPALIKELLLDRNFDERTDDWMEYSEQLDDTNIFQDLAAQSGMFAVRLGPARDKALEQEFADLSQQFTVPEGTVKLTVSGYYKLMPGTVGGARDAADDYTTLSLFSLEIDGDFKRYTDYHTWRGNSAAQSMWTSFSYDTPKGALKKVLGQDITLDLVTETWDTRYAFDSMSLTATICE